ncbi:MAG: glycosyltransferase [Pseudomonadales bacterium]
MQEIKVNIGEIANLIRPAKESNQVTVKVENALRRMILLKLPIIKSEKIVEKGILLIKFSETFRAVLENFDCNKLVSAFHIVLEPSWSGYALEEILAWSRYSKHKIYIEAAEKQDYDFISQLNVNLVPIRAGSGDWVDYRLFSPASTRKDFECVCVANYTDVKRLHIYIKAIYKLSLLNENFKSALICANFGENGSRIRKIISAYGIDNNLTLFEALNSTQLCEVVSKSKVNVLLSLREGSNRSLFEGFLVNTPGIVLKENHGVNKDNFNSMTGHVIDEKNLVDSLLFFSSSWKEFHPRTWAYNHISPEKTTEKIFMAIQQEGYLSSVALESVFLKVNSPEAMYMHKNDDINKSMSDQMILKSLSL